MSFIKEWAQSVREMPVAYHYIFILVISMIPVVEQRGAIPIGIALFGMKPLPVFLLTLAGSLIPAPFILLGFDRGYKWLGRFRLFRPFLGWLDRRLRKNSPKIEKYKEIGLITFVGIPIPTTGIWAGSMIATIIGLKFIKSIVCLALGGLISASAITLLVAMFGWLS